MGRSSRIFIFLSMALLLAGFASGVAEASGRFAPNHGVPPGHVIRHRADNGRADHEGAAALLISGPAAVYPEEPPAAPRFVRLAGPAFIRPCVRPLILRIGHQPAPRPENLPRVVYGAPACAY